MQISGTLKPRRRWIGTIVLGIVVIALLVGAAFVWGNVLKADTTASTTQNTSAAPATFYSDSLGAAAANASAPFYSDSLGASAAR